MAALVSRRLLPLVSLARAMVKFEDKAQHSEYHEARPVDWGDLLGETRSEKLKRRLSGNDPAAMSEVAVVSHALIFGRIDQVPKEMLSKLPACFRAVGRQLLGPSHLFYLVSLFFQSGEDDLFWSVIDEALTQEPDQNRRSALWDMRFYIAYCAFTPWNQNQSKEECDQIVAHLWGMVDDVARDMPASWKNVSIYKAYVRCAEGRYQEALTHFREAQNQQGYYLKLYMNYELAVTLDQFQDMHAGYSGFPHGQQTEALRHTGADRAHLVSCDKTYFDLYFPAFLQSFSRKNRGELLHIHAVNFRLSETQLGDLEKQFGVLINATFDTIPEIEESRELRRGYAAGARYIWLHRYMELYGFVVITDLDGQVRYSLDALSNRQEADVYLKTAMFREGGAHAMIWTRILAGTFAIHDTPATKKMAHSISAYLFDRFENARHNGKRYFFSDQMALALAHLQFENHITFAEIDPLYVQGKKVPKNLSIFQG